MNHFPLYQTHRDIDLSKHEQWTDLQWIVVNPRPLQKRQGPKIVKPETSIQIIPDGTDNMVKGNSMTTVSFQYFQKGLEIETSMARE